ncbi:MAG: type IX secretion system membrane protein PorP/SprF [Cytophagales bacterium]|nr:type IX secretion system membrane protein PorP/SprF [Cytophagales bacterium]
MKKLITILSIIAYCLLLPMFIGTYCLGQDIHFSQFYASPLSLNPALTGSIEGQFRGGLNFRDQWIGKDFNPFVTSSVFFDAPLLRNMLGKDWAGGGIVLINDVAGGYLITTKVLISGSYHKSLGISGNSYLSIGIGGGFVQKSVDYGKYTYDNQWTPAGFNDGMLSGETFNNSIGYGDFHSGINYTNRPTQTLKFYAGVSAFHLSSPQETFLDLANDSIRTNQLGLRPVIHGGAEIDINETINLMPGFLIMLQKSAKDILVGTSAGYVLSESKGIKNEVLLGAWFRSSGSVIATTGIKINGFTVGLSYDWQFGKLTQVDGIGALELSLIYEAKPPTKRMAVPGL